MKNLTKIMIQIAAGLLSLTIAITVSATQVF